MHQAQGPRTGTIRVRYHSFGGSGPHKMKRHMRLAVLLLLAVAVAGQGRGNGGTGDRERGTPPPDKTPPPSRTSRQSVSGDRPPPSVNRQGSASERKFILQSNGFNVEINAAAPVPFFKYWSDEAEIQMIKLDRMFQTSTSEDLSASDPLSPVKLTGAYDWTFGDATSTVDASTNTTNVQFIMTGAPKQTGADKPTPNLEFTCNLLSNANGTEIKFDVAVSNFQETWWAESAQALIFGYRVTTVDTSGKDKANITMQNVRVKDGAQRPNRPSKNDTSASKPKMAMDFGNGNGMEVVTEATQTNGDPLWVAMTAVDTPRGGSFVLIMYQRFVSGFTHDPSLFTAATSGTVPSDSPTLWANAEINLGDDTVAPPALTTTPAPNLSGASALCSGWVVTITALLAVLLAGVGRQ